MKKVAEGVYRGPFEEVYPALRECGAVPEAMEMFWDELGDIPVNDDGIIQKEYLWWPAGTNREDIWHWFDDKYPGGVAKLMSRTNPALLINDSDPKVALQAILDCTSTQDDYSAGFRNALHYALHVLTGKVYQFEQCKKANSEDDFAYYFSKEETFAELHEVLEWLDPYNLRTIIDNTDFRNANFQEVMAVARIMNALENLYEGLSELDHVAID